MPSPENARPRPAGTGSRPQFDAPWGVQRQYSRPAVQTPSRPRRCPWFAEVVRLAADPVPPYDGWRGVAILYAGSGSWERAAETRQAGRRACTVCPPDAQPSAIVWPPVWQWLVDAGDLEAGEAIELARTLVDHGAELVVLLGDRLRGGLTLRRASA